MTDQHYDAFKWATENEIRIYPKIKDDGFILILERDGKTETSGKIYPKKDYQNIIWEFYLNLYNKAKDD